MIGVTLTKAFPLDGSVITCRWMVMGDSPVAVCSEGPAALASPGKAAPIAAPAEISANWRRVMSIIRIARATSCFEQNRLTDGICLMHSLDEVHQESA